MQEGTIVNLTDKGYGFIHAEGIEKDIFFHSRELVNAAYDSLNKGDRVSFELNEDEKGKNATTVTKI